MEQKWLSTDFNHDQIILAGDIGGTNTNLAIVGVKKGKFTIILECVYKSAEVSGLVEPLKEVINIATAKNSALKPSLCCISGAGPVENNKCTLTNLKWNIDGQEIKKAIAMETLVINDFLAIGYGIPTLNVDDPNQITKLPHPDGSLPKPQNGASKAVVGAGTGLGVGFLVAVGDKYYASPSEGGHSGFASFDDESRKIKDFVAKKLGKTPGTEPFVSGQGINNIYQYFKAEGLIKPEGIFQEIEAASDEEKPALISKNAATNKTCKDIMKIFIKMYGRFASNAALLFLALGGLYLAGGIASKNEALFLEDNLFMKNFAANYKDNIQQLLAKIPVYIVKDYSISLYGAANAAVT
ncbi:MAG TPA: glucokinase, partial [Bacillota bacterium]|nr:glucokinase [Bacillota bacterium]